jgi:tetratricopeptide (TPR) repeat protein
MTKWTGADRRELDKLSQESPKRNFINRMGWSRWGVCLATLVALLMLDPGAAIAQSSKYTFGQRNQKKMLKVISLIREDGNMAAAQEVLEGINLKRAKPYGRARISNMLGSLAAQDGDFEKALGYFQASLVGEALQPEDHLRSLFMVGQLQTMLERYDDAIVTLEAWISRVESPSPSAYYILAATYYRAERPDDALIAIKKTIELSPEPREPWYRMLLSLHLERSEYEEALAILDDIILAYPKKIYWSQMAAIYAQQDNMSKSLAAQLLAKGEGYVTESRDLTRVAQMFMVEGLPHRGAAIMKQGLADDLIEKTEQAYQTFSDTLLQSREWALALAPLGIAADLHEDGSLYVRQAQVNLQLGRWGDARTSLDLAFEKGDLPDEGQAHILYGIAAANDKRWSSAVAAFGRAGEFEGTKIVAGKWIGYVKREQARLGGE